MRRSRANFHFRPAGGGFSRPGFGSGTLRSIPVLTACFPRPIDPDPLWSRTRPPRPPSAPIPAERVLASSFAHLLTPRPPDRVFSGNEVISGNGRLRATSLGGG